MKRVMMYDESSDETDNESEIIKQLKENFIQPPKIVKRCRF